MFNCEHLEKHITNFRFSSKSYHVLPAITDCHHLGDHVLRARKHSLHYCPGDTEIRWAFSVATKVASITQSILPRLLLCTTNKLSDTHDLQYASQYWFVPSTPINHNTNNFRLAEICIHELSSEVQSNWFVLHSVRVWVQIRYQCMVCHKNVLGSQSRAQDISRVQCTNHRQRAGFIWSARTH